MFSTLVGVHTYIYGGVACTYASGIESVHMSGHRSGHFIKII